MIGDVLAFLSGVGIGIVFQFVVAMTPRLLRGPKASKAIASKPEAVNVFEGFVFPDPADPRWNVWGTRDKGQMFRFGDSEITLSCLRLLVQDVEVAQGVETAGRYYDAVQAARVSAKRLAALQTVGTAVLAAGYQEKAERAATGQAEDQAGVLGNPAGQENLYALGGDMSLQRHHENALAMMTERARNEGYRVGWEAAMGEARVAAAGLVRDALAANRPDLAREAQRLWNILYGP